MRLLSIETATSVCGVALLTDDVLQTEESVEARNIHAERLLGMIDGTLRTSGLRVRDLDAVAISIGPGSFTGLRIGLSVAKGLVFGLEIEMAAVPTLEALAWRLTDPEAGDASPYVLAAIDARRDEVYCQLFRRSDRALVASGPPQDLHVPALHELLEGKQVTVTGDGAEKVLSVSPPGVRLSPARAGFGGCSAATVGLLGGRLLRAGQGADPATLEPWYIKEFFLRTASL